MIWRGGKWCILEEVEEEGRGVIAGSPPWEPPVGGIGTAGWPGPPEGPDWHPPPPPRSSARSGQRPSGRSPGCRDSEETRFCPGLHEETTRVRQKYGCQ